MREKNKTWNPKEYLFNIFVYIFIIMFHSSHASSDNDFEKMFNFKKKKHTVKCYNKYINTPSNWQPCQQCLELSVCVNWWRVRSPSPKTKFLEIWKVLSTPSFLLLLSPLWSRGVVSVGVLSMSYPVCQGCRIHWLHLCRELRHPSPMGPPVGCGWQSMMAENQILVAEQSATHILDGHMTCNIPLWPLLRLERPDLITKLVVSSPNTYMIKFQSYSSNCFYGKQTPSIFILKVLEDDGWVSITLRETVYENYFYYLIIHMKSYVQKNKIWH